MARRISVLVFLVAAVVLAACSADPMGPGANRELLRNLDEPVCVDTIYEPADTSSESRRSGNSVTPQGSSREPCHVVIIYY
jgi:hypothetical protein